MPAYDADAKQIKHIKINSFWKSAAMCIMIAVLVAGVAALAVNGVVCWQAKPYFIDLEDIESDQSLQDFDCVIVLGARVYSDGRLSGILRDRAWQGIAAYNAGASETLLFSGDHGQLDYDEVNAMRIYAEEKGIEKDRIFLDHAGFSTYESMVRLRDVFGAKKPLIVTQEYHLYRAVYIARTIGMDAYGIKSDLNNYPGRLRFELREIPGRVKDFAYCNILKPKPKYLGDPIDLKGAGTVTHDEDLEG